MGWERGWQTTVPGQVNRFRVKYFSVYLINITYYNYSTVVLTVDEYNIFKFKPFENTTYQNDPDENNNLRTANVKEFL